LHFVDIELASALDRSWWRLSACGEGAGGHQVLVVKAKIELLRRVVLATGQRDSRSVVDLR
jgi:hypothetical protein